MANNEALAPDHQPDHYLDLPVGQILRNTREYYGQSLEQIESALRIRATLLEAIEEGNLEALPGRVYAIGFVRSYSEYLRLDPNQMVHLFKEQYVGNRRKPELSFPVVASDSKIPQIPLIVGGLITAIIIFVVSAYFLTPSYEQEQIPELPQDIKETVQEIEEETSLASMIEDVTEPVLQPSASQPDLILNITENSWVEIKEVSGAVKLRRILKPGDQYLVPKDQDLILSTGNAGGIEVRIAGQDPFPLGKRAQVRRNIILKPESFIQNIQN